MKKRLPIFFAALLLAGCGTTAGIGFANFLESAANARIIAVASQAGAASIFASLGGNISPDAQAALSSAAAGVIDTAGTGVVWAIGEALRGKQGTSSAAKSGVLTATLTANAGAPAKIAYPVAKAVTALTIEGIPADAANEAVAVTVQSVAHQRGKRCAL